VQAPDPAGAACSQVVPNRSAGASREVLPSTQEPTGFWLALAGIGPSDPVAKFWP